MIINPDHNESKLSLKRIEGQVKGVMKMLEERKYCVDIITQIQSVRAALSRVEREILQKHIENCVASAVRGKSYRERDKKLEELFKLLKKL